MGYFKDIYNGISSTLIGMGLTAREMVQPNHIVTIQYPKESIPVPDTGRYRLHNNIDECIGCNQCANACPVSCIEITSFKRLDKDVETVKETQKKRLWVEQFDIDMSKCMFCGLCTWPCPTECITMTKVYDYSVFDFRDHIYKFSDMTPVQIAEKKAELEAYTAEQAALKATAAAKKAAEAAAAPKPETPAAPAAPAAEKPSEG